MRPVRVASELRSAMEDHARRTYPDECCGFLIAGPDPPGPSGPRAIVAVEPAPNEFEGERRRRFLLRPEELLAAEQRHSATGRVVAGFYHSHPDHPARPSQFDQEHAWPWYTYVVLAVTAKKVGDTRAFELDADRQVFEEVPLLTVGAEVEVPPVAEGLARP